MVLAERLLAIARLAYGRMPKAANLTRTQWVALHYFARANRRSRTATAFSLYHGTSLASVSESISALVRRGLLSRYRCRRDRRNFCLDLTDDARRLLSDDPAANLEKAIESLSNDQLDVLEQSAYALMRSMSVRQKTPIFGLCRFCKFCKVPATRKTDGAAAECERFTEAVPEDELDSLCIEFELGWVPD